MVEQGPQDVHYTKRIEYLLNKATGNEWSQTKSMGLLGTNKKTIRSGLCKHIRHMILGLDSLNAENKAMTLNDCSNGL